MKTIQMTIDDRLLQLVDKMSRARNTTRSAFIRDALEAEIRRFEFEKRRRDMRKAMLASLSSQVVLTEEDGLPATCAANFDNLQTVPKSNIGSRIARLTHSRMREAEAATAFALGFESD